MGLIGYVNNLDGTLEPPPVQGGLFDYVFAADGVYVHGKREGLEVNFPVMSGEIRGLLPSWPKFKFDVPKVPLSLIVSMLVESGHYAQQNLETLFHFIWSSVYPWSEGWEKVIPVQERTPASCRPLDAEGPDSSYQKAILEIHSHHSMAARFSKDRDDKDETGFRLYGVVGRLDTAPEIRMRVGVYGFFWEIPASWVMELPEGLRDCNAMED